MNKLNDLDLEILECKYLEKFYYFLKFAEDEMLKGFQTKEKIKKQWSSFWGVNGDFSVGAERVVYALLNGKGIGIPNSSPVGSDLMFEVDEAYVHIDLKTVQTRNIGDFNTSIFVGENQNSYNHFMLVNKTEKRQYSPSLPHYYEYETMAKPCLTYFVTILYEDVDLDILNINLVCMPNGQLSNIYKEKVLKAGKNPGKTRFNFSEVTDFNLLKNKKRVKVIYMNEKKIKEKYSKELSFLLKLNSSQK
jgi:hypothetical protein